MMTGISVEALTFSMGGQRVLDGIDARFAPGELTAVLGPNGAGKSTLLACLAGLRQSDSGRVLLDGRPRGDFTPRDLARRIGLLPQIANVHWDVDVATLVAFGRYPHRGRWGDSKDDRAAVERAMATTDVAQFAARPVSALSGGEHARVLLARVLAGEPEWLLADEPLANLDPAHQHDALDCLRAVAAAGAGVIVVLHDLNHALRVADKVLLLVGGRVAAQGPPEAVLTPTRLREAYGIKTELLTGSDGRLAIISSGRAGPG